MRRRQRPPIATKPMMASHDLIVNGRKNKVMSRPIWNDSNSSYDVDNGGKNSNNNDNESNSSNNDGNITNSSKNNDNKSKIMTLARTSGDNDDSKNSNSNVTGLWHLSTIHHEDPGKICHRRGVVRKEGPLIDEPPHREADVIAPVHHISLKTNTTRTKTFFYK